MSRPVFAAIAVVLVSASSAAPGSPPDTADHNPHLWRPAVTSVTVFKNGLGFFMCDGAVRLRDGWCVAAEVPPAAFGTLAIYAHAADQAVDLVGSGPGEAVDFDGRDAGSDPATRRARLQAARGLKVQLTSVSKGVERTTAGTLLSVGPEYVVLDADGGMLAVPGAAVTRMQVLELPLRVHVIQDSGQPAEVSTLGMAYLRKGITWIPEYTVKVLDDTSAEITLRGTLINEAEDLVHTDVNFVVGVPNFVHGDFLAPIAVGQIIRTIGGSVAPPLIQAQVMNRAAVASDRRGDQFTGHGPGVVERPAADREGDFNRILGGLPRVDTVGSDYAVYTRKDLTVRRGEKAIVTLMVKRVKYSHLYRWQVPEPLRHSLVLHNQTDAAWTTGPVLLVSAGQPLSQDLLSYTPMKGEGEIPVTAAINISHDRTESESQRTMKDIAVGQGTSLDLVTIDGLLELKNFENRAARVIVTAPVPGKPIAAGDGGELSIDPGKLILRERCGSIRWDLTLGPGETKELSYRYERYVPSN
jgi:hypothetical protein